jgi:hypothetical protein
VHLDFVAVIFFFDRYAYILTGVLIDSVSIDFYRCSYGFGRQAAKTLDGADSHPSQFFQKNTFASPLALMEAASHLFFSKRWNIADSRNDTSR